jgi:hypothetical protein
MQWKDLQIGRRTYRISDQGDVFCTYLNRISKGHLNANGYRFVSVGGKKSISVHRLVMWAFVGPQAKGMDVNHLNGNKLDNRLENLEYTTRSGNIRHAIALGLKPPVVGAANGKAILCDDDVREIRRLKEQCGVRNCDLADMFGVHRNTISDVVRYAKWKHIKPVDPSSEKLAA